MGKSNHNNSRVGKEVEGEFGSYRIGTVIGQGGNGTVYYAEVTSEDQDFSINEPVVIKVLNKKSFSGTERDKREWRFKNEIDITRQIQNNIKGIIPIFDSSDFNDDGDMEWYLMPLAEGYDLNQKCSTKAKLENMRDVGKSISALHTLGYAHRDIKLANMLVYHGRLCLSDFGLAYNTQGDNTQITEMHERLGPLMICPPEMRSAEVINKVDYRKSDVYLFAKTLWIVLTKRKEGFAGGYNRSIEDLRLDNEELQVETMGPIHQLLEAATKYSCDDRIDMKECLNLIDEQLKIIDGEMHSPEINKWKYKDAIEELQEEYIPDKITYQNPSDIIKIMTKFRGLVFLRFSEIGYVYDSLALRNASLLFGNIFELEVKGNINKNTKRIRVAVNNFEIEKGYNCEIRTEIISDQPNDFPVFNNLQEASESIDDCIYINGNYIIEIVL